MGGAASCAVLTLAACGSRTGQRESQMTSFTAGETKADTANLFTLPSDQIAHLQIAPVAKGSLPRVLRLTGSVAYNAFTTTPVFSAVGGPVRDILVTPGDSVRAGQTLLDINSPDYSAARSAYLKAKEAFALADKNYKRAVDLLAHKAIAERDVQQAESDRSQAQSDVESSTDALRALGISDPEAMAKSAATLQVPLLAPVAGEIVERLVGPGQLLQAGATQCFTISDTSTVWVLVNVYQNDLGSVRIGDAVDITTDAYPGDLPRTDFLPRSGARSHHAHTAGADRHRKPRPQAQERHVRHRDGPRRSHWQRAAGARRRGAARHRESALRLRANRVESIRAPPGNPGRFVRRPHPNHQRPQ